MAEGKHYASIFIERCLNPYVSQTRGNLHGSLSGKPIENSITSGCDRRNYRHEVRKATKFQFDGQTVSWRLCQPDSITIRCISRYNVTSVPS